MTTRAPVQEGTKKPGPERMDEGKQAEAFVKWWGVMLGYFKSFALKAVLELRIPDILAKGGGELTVDEIAEKLPSKNVQIDYLGRIMTYAAMSDLFTEIRESDEVVDQGKKRFALTPISEMLVEDRENRTSFSYMTRFMLSNVNLEPSLNLSGAVLSGTQPVHLVYGKSLWEQLADDPEAGRAFHNGMACSSTLQMRSLLKVYEGFEGVKQLVDLGGGLAGSLMTILEAYPDMRGINFDLPHVISQAPNIPRVTHISGDMFQSVPEGDAIFLKWMLHCWSDQQSVQILKNCYSALPHDGKVIIVEGVLSDPKSSDSDDYAMDLIVLTHTLTGRERSAPDWRRILKAAGFQRVEIIPVPPFYLCVIEGNKS